jgi:hypothetical protein
MSWVFCAIVAGEAAAIPIYEGDNYLAILDIRPFTRGHTLGRRLVKGWGSTQPPTCEVRPRAAATQVRAAASRSLSGSPIYLIIKRAAIRILPTLTRMWLRK